jgi:hypothetical protein
MNRMESDESEYKSDGKQLRERERERELIHIL